MKGSIFPASFSLSSLNGLNGFQVYGLNSSDYLGLDIGRLGDFNGDSYPDFLLGARNASRAGYVSNGAVYVIFGTPTGFPQLLDLNLLNGTNGFQITGKSSGALFGYSFSAVDIDADGYPDLLIGAPFQDASGTIYGFWGGPNLGAWSINLNNLSGKGFELSGEFPGNLLGTSIHGGRDINGDGLDDAIFSAPGYNNSIGRSYLLWGRPDLRNTSFSLNNFSAYGVKINGEAPSDLSGQRVRLLYDVNGDPFDDVLIGAVGARTSTGRQYLLSGGPTISSSPEIQLSDIRSPSGVLFNGEVAGDQSGWSLGPLRDFNGDGLGDFLIGAWQSSGNKGASSGRTYLVYGNPSFKNISTFELATLTNQTGSIINGEKPGDASGYWVESIDDFDGDGREDFMIGAGPASHGNLTFEGRTYFFRGAGRGLFQNSTIDLGGLDGLNGFSVDGAESGDYSGSRIADMGDINGDGLSDVMISSYRASRNGLFQSGCVHALYGDMSPQFWFNELTHHQGEFKQFGAQYLNVTDNQPVWYELSGIQRLQFEFDFAPGVPITNFSKAQQPSVWVRHDGTAFPGAYKAYVPNTGIAVARPPEDAEVTFYRRPTLTQPATFSMSQGSRIPFTTSRFDVSSDYNSSMLIFDVTANSSWFSNSSSNLTQFTRDDMLRGAVFYEQDDSRNTPGFSITARDPYFTEGPFSSSITLIPTAPTWVNLQLTLNPGDVVNITTADFLVNAPGVDPTNLTITITSNTHGYFRSISRAQPVTTFTMADVMGNDIQYISDGSAFSPFYQATVSDGTYSVGPQSVTVRFNGASQAVVLQNKNLNIAQGQTVTVTTSQLSALSLFAPPSQVIFTIGNPQHLTFTRTGVPVTSFSLQDVQQNLISVSTPLNNTATPSCEITVNDGLSSTTATPMVVLYTPVNQAPIIEASEFSFTQDTCTPVTSSNLRASDLESPAPTLVFGVSNLQGGYFTLNSSAGVPLSSFSQSTIDQILFCAYDLRIGPSFTISASDGALTTSRSATIQQYTLGDAPPIFVRNFYTFPQDGMTILNPSQLWITDLDNSSSELTITPINVSFSLAFDRAITGEPATSFTMQDVIFGFIRLRHQGPLLASFTLLVNDGVRTTSQLAVVTVTPVNHPPIVYRCYINATQGISQLLTAANFNATDPDGDPLFWTVSDVEHARFLQNLQTVVSFADSAMSTTRFEPDGTPQTPSLFCSASDGKSSTPPQPVTIDFETINSPPEIRAITLIAQQDTPTLLGPENLVLADDQTRLEDLIVRVLDAENGCLENINRPEFCLTTFPYATVMQRNVLAVPKGPKPLSFALQAVDGAGSSSNISDASISFTPTPQIASASGIDGRTIYTIVSAILGIILIPILKHLWTRTSQAAIRHYYPEARIIRKELNLEYNDFNEKEGAIFRRIVNGLMTYINSKDSGFLRSLSPSEDSKQTDQDTDLDRFIVLITKLLQQRNLVEPSGELTGLWNRAVCYSAGKSDRLKLFDFGQQYTAIADAALEQWKAASPEQRLQNWQPKHRSRADKVLSYLKPHRSQSRVVSEVEGMELVPVPDDRTGISSPSAQKQVTLWGEEAQRRPSRELPPLPQLPDEAEAASPRG